ncbi:DUF1737 domain-containing protein [Cronobacter malonaticus]|uniref:DUF1737 domain-containing protein n=1 Tax=Cronobacter malonaticus TaxID=413503 RepID=UPI000519DBE6|nr:DUF1737 domain-containing protein [Cronobacter malonaticus]EGT4373191.1 DUF1737 domain-containing protein [Cronobacter malonaticus]MDI6469486.1 DUF1737 domain-containing protein [Cronobacter malonaticus]HAU5445695.1 DUF1737 domain-containing protein [Cronobacter malonaticus]
MAITSIQTATAGSVANLVAVVKNTHIAASRYPQGGIRGVHATPTKVEYFQVVAAGGTAVTDYDVVVSQDRADFTVKCNAKITAGFLPIGDMSVIQMGPGRTIEYAQAFTKV